MADRDLLVVISEMLRKQDRHSELITETNNKLQKFIDISIEHFSFQHKFAEDQKKFNERQEKFNERQEKFNERQEDINVQILRRLDSIDSQMKNFGSFEERLKRLEEAVFK